MRHLLDRLKRKTRGITGENGEITRFKKNIPIVFSFRTRRTLWFLTGLRQVIWNIIKTTKKYFSGLVINVMASRNLAVIWELSMPQSRSHFEKLLFFLIPRKLIPRKIEKREITRIYKNSFVFFPNFRNFQRLREYDCTKIRGRYIESFPTGKYNKNS